MLAIIETPHNVAEKYPMRPTALRNLLPHMTQGETRGLRVSHCICNAAAPFHRPGCPFEAIERK
jgi:hypothetical protein